MGKVTHVERTIKDYHYWHKYLWDKIIKKVKKDNMKTEDVISIKNWAWGKIFDFNIMSNCFGCEWTQENKEYILSHTILRCRYCLFDTENDSIDTCLDENFNTFRDAETTEKRIKYATIIRDYPLKKEFRDET